MSAPGEVSFKVLLPMVQDLEKEKVEGIVNAMTEDRREKARKWRDDKGLSFVEFALMGRRDAVTMEKALASRDLVHFLRANGFQSWVKGDDPDHIVKMHEYLEDLCPEHVPHEPVPAVPNIINPYKDALERARTLEVMRVEAAREALKKDCQFNCNNGEEEEEAPAE